MAISKIETNSLGSTSVIHSDTTLALQTNGTTTAVTIDASQNVGIGTTSPSAKLHVYGGQSYVTGAAGAGAYSRWYNNAQTSSDLQVGQGWSSGSDNIGFVNNNANAALLFATNGTERARLATNGDFLVGTTSFSGTTDGAVVAPAGIGSTSNSGFNYTCYKAASATQGAYQVFFWNLGLVGYINYNGSGITYNASSDIRLKENIVDSASGLETLNKIKVREFDWKESKAHEPYGFIAQELHEVYPSAVTAQKDKEDGSMDMPWAVDYGRLTPMLVKAVQELNAKVTELEAKLASK